MMREDWIVVKVTKDKFAICPTFIHNWCVVYYAHMKNNYHLPKQIKGRTFVERYNIAIDYVYSHNDDYELLDDDFKRLEGYYFQMREYAFLNGMYKSIPKRRVY